VPQILLRKSKAKREACAQRFSSSNAPLEIINLGIFASASQSLGLPSNQVGTAQATAGSTK
jgi:hypothetical protein